jgi:hypothetical protein
MDQLLGAHVNSPPSASGPRAARPGDRIAFGNRAGTVFTVRGSAAAPLYIVDFDGGHRSLISPGPDTRVEAVPFGELAMETPARKRRRSGAGEKRSTARPAAPESAVSGS